MPTYDYRCGTCGISFELFQSFHDETLVKCPTKKSGKSPEGCTSAGRGRVSRVFSAPGITFKGSGFYKTDSRASSGVGSKSRSDNGSESSSDSKSSTSKDSSDSKSTSSSGTRSSSTKSESTKTESTKSTSGTSGD